MTEMETAFTDTKSITIPLAKLTDGEHLITMTGEAADGDSFRVTHAFTVDTMPPQLLLSSPVNGSFFNKDGTITFTGIADADARFTVSSDDKVICDGMITEELSSLKGGSFTKSTGEFSFTLEIPDPDSMSQRTLSISVSNDVGNATEPQTVTVSHGGLADLCNLKVMVNNQIFENGNIPVPASGLQNAELTLLGTMQDGSDFKLTGYNIFWDVLTVDGAASVEDGKLSAQASSQGMVSGKLAVADNAYRSASICFGTPLGHAVAVASSIGGTVSGGGYYNPGDTVTLVATPDSGYEFGGWTITGISGVDTSSTTISFTMPQDGNVNIEAKFTATVPSTSSENPNNSSGGSSGKHNSKNISGYYDRRDRR